MWGLGLLALASVLAIIAEDSDKVMDLGRYYHCWGSGLEGGFGWVVGGGSDFRGVANKGLKNSVGGPVTEFLFSQPFITTPGPAILN